MNEKIIEFLINCLPCAIAVLTCILTSFKLMSALKDWKDSNDMSSISQLEKDLKNIVKQNLELKNNLSEVLKENSELKERLKGDCLQLIEEAEKKSDKNKEV